MRSKWLVLVVVLVIASMVLGACKKAPEAPGQTLRINLGSYPDIIDPQKSSFVNEIAHLQLMYEGLTKLNTALETGKGRHGLQTMCEGAGMANATLIERI